MFVPWANAHRGTIFCNSHRDLGNTISMHLIFHINRMVVIHCYKCLFDWAVDSPVHFHPKSFNRQVLKLKRAIVWWEHNRDLKALRDFYVKVFYAKSLLYITEIILFLSKYKGIGKFCVGAVARNFCKLELFNGWKMVP